jgi:hypothetical protein
MEWLTVSFIVSVIVTLCAFSAPFLLMTRVLIPLTVEDGTRIVPDDHGTAWLVACGICLVIAIVATIVEPGNWAYLVLALLGGSVFGLYEGWAQNHLGPDIP